MRDLKGFLKLLQDRYKELTSKIAIYEGLSDKDCIEILRQYHTQRYELLIIINIVQQELLEDKI